jgi:hypothetical protein
LEVVVRFLEVVFRLLEAGFLATGFLAVRPVFLVCFLPETINRNMEIPMIRKTAATNIASKTPITEFPNLNKPVLGVDGIMPPPGV